MTQQRVVVVGAGPVGALAALYAANRGDDVHVYELRAGTHICSLCPHKLFNTALFMSVIRCVSDTLLTHFIPLPKDSPAQSRPSNLCSCHHHLLSCLETGYLTWNLCRPPRSFDYPFELHQIHQLGIIRARNQLNATSKCRRAS